MVEYSANGSNKLSSQMKNTSAINMATIIHVKKNSSPPPLRENKGNLSKETKQKRQHVFKRPKRKDSIKEDMKQKYQSSTD